jgi:hypothetical protein
VTQVVVVVVGELILTPERGIHTDTESVRKLKERRVIITRSSNNDWSIRRSKHRHY